MTRDELEALGREDDLTADAITMLLKDQSFFEQIFEQATPFVRATIPMLGLTKNAQQKRREEKERFLARCDEIIDQDESTLIWHENEGEFYTNGKR